MPGREADSIQLKEPLGIRLDPSRNRIIARKRADDASLCARRQLRPAAGFGCRTTPSNMDAATKRPPEEWTV